MANQYNFWAAMSKAFQDEMVDVVLNEGTAVTFPLLNDLHPDTYEVFSTIYDSGAMERLFRTWHAKNYRCWNCYATKPDSVSEVRDDLDSLYAAYPTDFSMVGAWVYADGRPVGMQWDDSEPPVLVGDPWYPQPPETIQFMPDVPDPNSPDPENPDMIRPTEVTDVLLCAGQPPRIFTEATAGIDGNWFE